MWTTSSAAIPRLLEERCTRSHEVLFESQCLVRSCGGCECPRVQQADEDVPSSYTFSVATAPDAWLQLCVPAKCGNQWWLNVLFAHDRLRQSRNLPCTVRGPFSRVERVLLVRNPYERLLSAYFEQVTRWTQNSPHMQGLVFGYTHPVHCRAHCELLWQPTPADFDRFTRRLVANGNNSTGWVFSNDHLLYLQHPLMPRGCVTPAFRNHSNVHDFYRVLKLEEQATWYPGLMRRLGLVAAVNDSRSWGADGCAWKPQGGTCQDALQEHQPGRARAAEERACVRDGRETVSGQSAATLGGNQKAHSTGACAKLREFYTPELAALVTEWARADLVAFDYPAWNPALSDRPASSSRALRAGATRSLDELAS